MKFKFLDKEIKYDGSQLHSHFNYENGLEGNSISCFFGPAEVKEHLVDCEDKLKNDFINSAYMMHFIIEIFEASLREAVVWQRLFIAQIAAFLKKCCLVSHVAYRGDDIFIDNKKLSVSIATKSPVSCLIHVGLNIEVGDECPVLAVGFNDFDDYGYALRDVAHMLMAAFVEEFEDIQKACYKVKGVQ